MLEFMTSLFEKQQNKLEIIHYWRRKRAHIIMILFCSGVIYFTGKNDACDIYPHQVSWKICLTTVGIEPDIKIKMKMIS